jgi:hypothetical protein
MKKILYFFPFLFLFIYSCSSKKETSKEDSVATSAADTVKPGKPIDTRLEVAVADTTIPFAIEASKIKENVKWQGELTEAWIWYDKNGKNILVLSKENWVKHEEEDVYNANLFAKHFIVKKESKEPLLLWETHDFIHDCIFDLTAEFIISPVIVDSDRNGIMETYLVYKISCRSDVSPAHMKIIVHEGKQKYALRGIMAMKVNGYDDSLYVESREPDLSKIFTDKATVYANLTDWGRFENANDFKTAPAFYETARQLWIENRIEE